MTNWTTTAAAALLLAISPAISAADAAAGKASAALCSGCHGPEGVSVSADIPNLAGQKAEYLEGQLQAFRSGKRANPLMAAMAAQLDDDAIANLAAHFSALAGASGDATGPLAFDGTRVAYPEGYESDFTFYGTSNRADNGTVRFLFANDAAMKSGASEDPLAAGSVIMMEVYKAAKDAAGDYVVGADGVYEKADLAGYAVMENKAGFGEAYPAGLRNGDWSYAFFTADKQHRPGINEAKCLACHQPLGDADYMFTAAALRKKAAAMN